MKPLPSVVFGGLLVLMSSSCAQRIDEIVLAAPASLHQSGFTDFVVPTFEKQFGVRVRVVLSNQVSSLSRAGGADVVIGHEPESEQRLIDEGVVGYYRKVMFNRFLIVGPAGDPANVRGAATAADAFRRIAQSCALFLSRADGSPTATRERQLWRLAGGLPHSRVEIRADMANTLRATSEQQGYTLTVQSLYQRMRGELNLLPLFERDDAMLNTYSLSVRRGGPSQARRFAEWLAEGSGRPLVERFRVGGRAVFSLWPVTAPSKTPASVPMDMP